MILVLKLKLEIELIIPQAFSPLPSLLPGESEFLFGNSFSGAEAPNVFIPIVMPSCPTYCDQPSRGLLYRDSGFNFRGQNAIAYSAGCFSKISQEGMLTLALYGLQS